MQGKKNVSSGGKGEAQMARRSEGLSERHRKIMLFLEEFQENNGYSPSIREIGDSIGVKSTSLVDYYLTQLEQRGYISRDDRVSRSIRVVKSIQTAAQTALKRLTSAAAEVCRVPVYGRIVASAPIPMPSSDVSYFDPESSVEIAASMLPVREKRDELFALEVDGDSMIDAMINDGDIVVMRKAQEAVNGDMVAVWLDDVNETTLKYFYREGSTIRLQPANPAHQPIYVKNPAALRIMGKVVMVIRQVPTVA
jgi:repressor LexA